MYGLGFGSFVIHVFCEFVLCICVYAYVWTGPDLIYLEYTNVDRV